MAERRPEPEEPLDRLPRSVRWPGAGPISPRLSVLLIGGLAMAALGCMCMAVLVLAVWRAT